MKETYADDDIIDLLQATTAIVVVGASPNPGRYSHKVMSYMQHVGYRTIPVNPNAAGETILGEQVYATLKEVPAPFELIDVFRKADAIPAVTREVIALREDKGIGSLWLQLDLYNEAAASEARAAGLTVVMDRCLKIEYGRLIAHSG